jgi:elongation factor 1-alpha
MSEMDEIKGLIRGGESTNVEFKEYLSKEVHLQKERMHSLASQMKYRVLSGNGSAIYLVGVSDKGEIKGIERSKLNETIDVLEAVAKEAGLRIVEKKVLGSDDNLVSKIVIERKLEKEHLLVATAGHVDHGKSTLIGTLVSGKLDDGKGKTRKYLDRLKHELERGLSADISYAVYGFKNGEVIRLNNPLSKKEKARIVEKCAKVVSFVDTVGHEPWLRTTIRGIVGQKLDYGILTIAADDGITHITKEHLAILLAMELPVIIAITKIDRVESTKDVEKEIVDVLNLVGKVPKFIRSERDMEFPAFWESKVLVPVIKTSAKTGEGLSLLDKLLYMLPKRASELDKSKKFLMYIDKVYRVPGVGHVVSGSIKEGVVRKGDELYIGPSQEGKFDKVKASSIEIHYFSVEKAEVGEIVGVALKGLELNPRRGMILSGGEYKPSMEFEANVVVLNHPTKISKGYEPVVHLETISETVIVEPLDAEFLAAGDRGKVRMRFKYRPYFIREGQKFVFREGRSKGIGIVIKVYEH